MTLHRSTCIPAPEFSHRETKEPVPPQGTLERLLLRTEQTGWSVVYYPRVVSYGHSSASDCLPGGRGSLEAGFQPGVYSVCSYPTLGRSGSGSVDYRLPAAVHEPDGGNSLAFGDRIGRRGMGFKLAGGQSCRAPTVACDSQRYLGSIGHW